MSSLSLNMFSSILNPVSVKEMARSWINEDIPNFDLQGAVAGNSEAVAKIYGKSPGILAGIPFANAVFNELECSPNWCFSEGEFLEPTCEVAYVGGKANNLLQAERVVLNILSRCSGVATGARRMKRIVSDRGWPGQVAGTRKTTPGFRMVEKYGLMVGGASTHRYDLSNMIMLKDNHVTLCGGSVKRAISEARKVAGFMNKIEVECRTFEEAQEAAITGADIIMLDNFSTRELQSVSNWIKNNYPSILVEASGGITYENVIKYAIPTVDIVSLSSLVQGYNTLDFSMKIVS